MFVPVQQYRHGHGLARGLEQGVRSMTVETIDLARLLFGSARNVLESVDSLFQDGDGDGNGRRHRGDGHLRRRRIRAPTGFHSGLRHAYFSLARAMQSASRSLIAVPREEFNRSGTAGLVKSVVRGVPSAL